MQVNKGLMFAALGMGLSDPGIAAEGTTGFIAGSSAEVLARTLYFNQDYHYPGARQSYTEDTSQGFILRYRSGFTDGPIGVGVDAIGQLGLKLDSGSGRNAWATLPVDADSGRTHDSTSELGAALKLRYAATTLKYGEQTVSLPVLATMMGRLLTETAQGALLHSEDIPGLSLDAGHFTAMGSQFNARHDGRALTRAEVAGGKLALSDQLSASLYYSSIQDHFEKRYFATHWTVPVDLDRLSLDFNLYRTTSQGAALSGPIDNLIWSLAGAWQHGPHTLTLAYQQSRGDTGYAYGVDGGSAVWLANSVQYSDFMDKDETSWQLRYDYDFAALGIPGLSFMTRYISGRHIDTGEVDDGKEWERNVDLRYVIQSGPAKDTALQIRHASHRSSALGNSLDELRLIVDHPIRLF